MREIKSRMIANLDPDGERLAEFGETFSRTLVHNGELVSCRGALSQAFADHWCVTRARDIYGWKFRESWWQIWRPENPLTEQQKPLLGAS